MKNMGRSIVLFGAGGCGERFLIKNFNKIIINEFWDNRKTGMFHGYPIQKPYYREDMMIIVTVDSVLLYAKLRQQLLELGYTEFEDFIPYTIYKKRMVIAYGNCHMAAVRQYLELQADFMEAYGFYPLASIQDIQDIQVLKNIIPKSELFIYQPIRKENGYGEEYASEEILKYARANCCTLSIPNLYGMCECFFPQLQIREKPSEFSNLVGYEEKNIVKWLYEGSVQQDMEKFILEGGVYNKKEILDLWREFQTKLTIREKDWDIKISDYIYKYYKKEKLFTDRWHISTILAREIANRVLIYLGYSPSIESILPILDDYEVFIYKDVKEALGLEFEEKSIRKYARGRNSLDTIEMSIKSYVEMCIQVYVYESGQ